MINRFSIKHQWVNSHILPVGLNLLNGSFNPEDRVFIFLYLLGIMSIKSWINFIILRNMKYFFSPFLTCYWFMFVWKLETKSTHFFSINRFYSSFTKDQLKYCWRVFFHRAAKPIVSNIIRQTPYLLSVETYVSRGLGAELLSKINMKRVKTKREHFLLLFFNW